MSRVLSRTFFALLIAAVSLPAQQYRAFWADAFHYGFKTPDQVDRMMEDVAAAKANAIFVEVRIRGGSYYLQSLEPPVEDSSYSPGFDALQYAIDRAHERGIEVHAWFPVTKLWDLNRPPSDPRHAWWAHGPNSAGNDFWMTVSAKGQISQSVDPGHPDVLRYLAEVILYPATRYDLDGLHLDYIRYPEDADYGWNPVSIARFQRLTNRTDVPAAGDGAFSDYRRKNVTDLVRQIYLRAYAIRPSIKISAALITWGNGPTTDGEFKTKDAYARVFQDWRSWVEEGILDLAIPMNYFREASLPSYLDRWMEFEKDRQYGRAALIGLASYLNPIPDSMAQVRRVQAPSLAGNSPLGVTFYSYASTNVLNSVGVPVVPNAEFYGNIGALFEEAAAVPDLPWKTNPTRGHIYGWLTVEGGPPGQNDGVAVWIESDSAGSTSARVITDGTGFFGAVDLPPDSYRVRVESNGREIYRSPPQELTAGTAARFDITIATKGFEMSRHGA